MEVVLMLPQVLRELIDALRQERNLHLRRPYIARMCFKVMDDLRFLFLGYGHSILHLKFKIGAP